MNRVVKGALAASLLAVAVVGPALAQRGGDVVGKWKVEAAGMSGSNQTCDVELKATESFGAYGASSFGCSGDLFGVSKWRVRGSQVVILGMGDRELAVLTLRGDQLVGTDKSGRPVVFSRAGAPPRVPNADRGSNGGRDGGQWGGQWNGGGQRDGQWNGGGGSRDGGRSCTTEGDSGRCAQPSSMRAPAPGDSIQTLMAANLRERPGAGRTLGVVPKRACLVVDDCVRADGVLWCRVDHGGQIGYVRQTAEEYGQRKLVFQYACG